MLTYGISSELLKTFQCYGNLHTCLISSKTLPMPYHHRLWGELYTKTLVLCDTTSAKLVQITIKKESPAKSQAYIPWTCTNTLKIVQLFTIAFLNWNTYFMILRLNVYSIDGAFAFAYRHGKTQWENHTKANYVQQSTLNCLCPLSIYTTCIPFNSIKSNLIKHHRCAYI